MRLLLAPAAIVAVSAAQAVAQAPLIGQQDIAYPGGVYISLAVEDAAACARQCTQDEICMAWTYRAEAENSCELKAVVAAPVPETGARSGLSARAPDFARRLANVAPAEETQSVSAAILGQTAPAPAAEPQPMVLAMPAPQSLPDSQLDQIPASAETSSEERNDLVLLGGPLEGDLRPTLRNAP